MRKDIHVPPAGQVKVGIVQETNEKREKIWNAYVLNFENFPLEKVIVNSSGYNEETGQKSSVLRHLIDLVPAQSYEKIEPISEEVFVLTNEYYITYFSDQGMHEVQVTFEKGSINSDNMEIVPFKIQQGIVRP